MLLIHPVPAFKQDVLNCLAPIAAFAGVGVGFVVSVEIRSETDLARAHLCVPVVCGENSLSWSDHNFVEVPIPFSLSSG
jgi:hypothetical protein